MTISAVPVRLLNFLHKLSSVKALWVTQNLLPKLETVWLYFSLLFWLIAWLLIQLGKKIFFSFILSKINPHNRNLFQPRHFRARQKSSDIRRMSNSEHSGRQDRMDVSCLISWNENQFYLDLLYKYSEWCQQLLF